VGGLLNASTPSAALVKKLQANSSHYTWVAATVGANTAAGYQLGTDDPVMAIGGFNGTDPHPSLAEFKQWVAEGKIHYFIGGGGTLGGFGGNFARAFAGLAGRGGTGGAATPRGAASAGRGLGTTGTTGGTQQSADASSITSWVESHFTAKVVGGVTIYDLTQPKS
jgi:hypothetical protein